MFSQTYIHLQCGSLSINILCRSHIDQTRTLEPWKYKLKNPKFKDIDTLHVGPKEWQEFDSEWGMWVTSTNAWVYLRA